MGVMDFFRGPASGTQQPVAPTITPAGNATNTTVPGASTPASNGSLPAIPAVSTGEASPLDGFQKLWQKEDTDAKPVSWTTNVTADPAKLKEVAAQADFVKQIDPAVMQQAAKGDPTALATAINLAAQAGFAQSAAATAGIVENALATQAANFRDVVVPDILRRNAISQEVRADNPLFQNPAVAPLLQSVESQMATKYPNSTPSQISQMAKDYLTGFSKELLGANGMEVTQRSATPAVSRGDTDWEKYFTL
jgi:hypothetical protein